MKRSVHSLMGSFLKAQEGLKNTAPDQLSVALEDYANRFSAFPWAADYLIRVGDDAMESGDRGTAFLYLDTAYHHFPSAGNKVTLYLRLAQYHLDAGNTEAGIQFLNLLCTATVDNYEESIECNGLAKSIPNRGVFAVGLTQQDLDDIFYLKILLEVQCVRWAIERITEERIIISQS